jgi:hypothetical protein
MILFIRQYWHDFNAHLFRIIIGEFKPPFVNRQVYCSRWLCSLPRTRLQYNKQREHGCYYSLWYFNISSPGLISTTRWNDAGEENVSFPVFSVHEYFVARSPYSGPWSHLILGWLAICNAASSNTRDNRKVPVMCWASTIWLHLQLVPHGQIVTGHFYVKVL